MGEIKNKPTDFSLKHHKILGVWLRMVLFVVIGSIGIIAAMAIAFEKKYEGKVYPTVFVGGVSFGGKTQKEVENYWAQKNEPFASALFELKFESTVATVSGTDLGLGYDARLSAAQAYSVGRSKQILSNLYILFINNHTDLNPYFRWNSDVVDATLTDLAEQIDIPVENALFSFENGKVTAFKPSRDGRRLNIEKAKQRLKDAFETESRTNQQRLTVFLPVDVVRPSVTTDSANNFGIRQLIGNGYSEFAGSIQGRIHNVVLAASRLNGMLIKPGETFSFNNAIGDISAATGYQSAYIIKDGHTVLGDGGGVCQVSTTLFRAALDAGLPIVERHAHNYRVHYYEEGGYKPGLDATVFAPSVDLKFKNDTPAYILIQTHTDVYNLTLTFNLYGTTDGRKSEIYNQKMWGVTRPPPVLYQDDPTLPKGVVKQVDFEAWGANASFQYRVTRDGQTLQDTTFVSNYRPWQAVYLRGTQ